MKELIANMCMSMKRVRGRVRDTSGRGAPTCTSISLSTTRTDYRSSIRYVDEHVVDHERRSKKGKTGTISDAKFKFVDEVHSAIPRDAIYLQDGESSKACQEKVLKARVPLASQEPSTDDQSEAGADTSYDDASDDGNESQCGLCEDSGQLVCCDNCPAAFHISCMGLEEVPDGEWFCPHCRCAACGESQSIARSTPTDVDGSAIVACSHCERQYHKRCVRSRFQDLKSQPTPQEVFFCTDTCEGFYRDLQNLEGSRQDLGGGFSCMLLRSHSKDKGNGENCGVAAARKTKLLEALDVMKECFSPVTVMDEGKKTDILPRIIFSRRSDSSYLNFVGFYTLIMEREGVIISVATVRVRGRRVAELPFVGTRLKYQRQGMCTRLMRALEAMLRASGVRRLVLPTMSSVRSTWINNFGFRPVNQCDKVQLVDLNILKLADTTLLCKQLDVDNIPRGHVNGNADHGEQILQRAQEQQQGQILPRVSEQQGQILQRAQEEQGKILQRGQERQQGQILPRVQEQQQGQILQRAEEQQEGPIVQRPQELQLVPKKRRGRPRKVKEQTTNLQSESRPITTGQCVEVARGSEPAILRRGRGRPPKDKDPPYRPSEDVPSKRSRGCGRTSTAEGRQFLMPSKRKPGRPRKNKDAPVQYGEKPVRTLMIKDAASNSHGQKRGRGRPRKSKDATFDFGRRGQEMLQLVVYNNV